MACLAPQFKWAPSPSAAHAPSPSSSSSRCSALRVHCAVTSAVVEADRASSGGATLRLAYASADPAPALQRTFESTLAPEVLLNEEAVVAAAAAEAVALARAAAEAAREVVRMVQNNNEQPVIRQKKGVDNYLANEILHTEMESSIPNEYVNDILLEDLESYGIMGDEGELDNDAQHTENIAVKSARQSERRARRTRAAIKAATSVRASQKTATSSKKKRSKGSSSSMNPLGSLWKMTGRRLLTAKEEVEFSQGIEANHRAHSVSPKKNQGQVEVESKEHDMELAPTRILALLHRSPNFNHVSAVASSNELKNQAQASKSIKKNSTSEF